MVTSATIADERRATDGAQPSTPRARWSFVALIALVPVIVAVYVGLPAAAAEAWFQVVAWTSILAFAVGMRRQAAASTGWVLVLTGFVMFAVGDLLFALNEQVFGIDAFPSTADVAYLSGYPALAIGLSALVRTDPVDRGRTALIDAGIFVTPVAVAGWIWFVAPFATEGGVTTVERVVSAAYPVGDLLCIALVVRLLAGHGAGRRSSDRGALRCLVAALAALLVADGVFLTITLHGDYVSGGWSDGLYLASYCLLAIAATHPLTRHAAPQRGVDEVSLSTIRLVLLAAAALVTPLLLAVQWWRGSEVTVPLVVAGTVVSFLLVVARMSGLVQALEVSKSQLRFEASHDLLTGLPNRQLFATHFAEALSTGEPGALLFVDLDRFKAVNDTLGHHVGDDVLVEVATIMRNAVRPNDVVARLSGDEFVIMIRSCDRETASAIAGRIVEHLQVRRRSGHVVLAVTASVGMVCWARDTPPDQAHHLLRAADHAMYEAKHAAGNQLVIVAA